MIIKYKYGIKKSILFHGGKIYCPFMTTTPSSLFEVHPCPIYEKEKNQYDSQGHIVLKNVLTKSQAGLLCNEVMAIMEIIGLEPAKLKQTHQYLTGSKLDHFVHAVAMREIASALTGGPSTLYIPFRAVKTAGEAVVSTFTKTISIQSTMVLRSISGRP
jgi:hypothetical protein